MTAEATKIALHTTNALKQSLKLKAHTIKRTTNFPLSLITEIDPSLKRKFQTTKAKTREQSLAYQNDMQSVNTKSNSLIIESDDNQTIDEVDSISRFIHHHSSVQCQVSDLKNPKFIEISHFFCFCEHRCFMFRGGTYHRHQDPLSTISEDLNTGRR